MQICNKEVKSIGPELNVFKFSAEMNLVKIAYKQSNIQKHVWIKMF